MTHAVFPAGDLIWATVAFAVLVSIGVHGVTASQVLRTLDRRAGRPTPETV
jgi:NhaP-type Na+/H+ or K+/H+ antiporter